LEPGRAIYENGTSATRNGGVRSDRELVRQRASVTHRWEPLPLRSSALLLEIPLRRQRSRRVSLQLSEIRMKRDCTDRNNRQPNLPRKNDYSKATSFSRCLLTTYHCASSVSFDFQSPPNLELCVAALSAVAGGLEVQHVFHNNFHTYISPRHTILPAQFTSSRVMACSRRSRGVACLGARNTVS